MSEKNADHYGPGTVPDLLGKLQEAVSRARDDRQAAASEAHAATLHGERVVCTCGDFNCASLDAAPEHEFTRETSGRMVRAVCSCGEWVGAWRSARAYLVEKALHSDEGGHLYAVRRAGAGAKGGRS